MFSEKNTIIVKSMIVLRYAQNLKILTLTNDKNVANGILNQIGTSDCIIILRNEFNVN